MSSDLSKTKLSKMNVGLAVKNVTAVEREGGTNWDIDTLSYIKYLASGKLLYCTGAQLCDLWWPKWWDGGEGGGSRGREYTYTYSWFALSYSEN